MTTQAKSGRYGLGFFNSLVLVFNILFVVALLLSYLSCHVSPQQSWLLPFFGLLYPVLILINLFFMLYWLIRRRWLFLLPALAIIAGWGHVERTVQIRRPVMKPAEASAFKLITYNVKNLSNDNVDLLEPEVRSNILNYIDNQNPDIICLQEFSIVHPSPEDFLDSLSERLNMPYHAHSLYLEQVRKRINAIYIFSKYPIINSTSLKKDDLHNYALYADIITGQDTVRMFNIHLESLRLRHEDYKFISDIENQLEKNEKVKESSKRIFNKIRDAFAKRSSQVDSLAACIKKSPYPVILCGDFNDTPNSYAYQKLTKNLTDSFLESGQGFGNTYTGNLPSYRIDYILYSDHFTSYECRRNRIVFSDHYPVSCWISPLKSSDSETSTGEK